MISVVIPTRDRELSLAIVLGGLVNEKNVGQIIIVDNSDFPIMDRSEIAHLYEVFNAVGKDFVILRNKRLTSVGWLRYYGASYAKRKYVLFMDDDAFLLGGSLDSIGGSDPCDIQGFLVKELVNYGRFPDFSEYPEEVIEDAIDYTTTQQERSLPFHWYYSENGNIGFASRYVYGVFAVDRERWMSWAESNVSALDSWPRDKSGEDAYFNTLYLQHTGGSAKYLLERRVIHMRTGGQKRFWKEQLSKKEWNDIDTFAAGYSYLLLPNGGDGD